LLLINSLFYNLVISYASVKASQGGATAVAAHVPMAKQAGATWDEIKGAILLTLTVSGVLGVLACLSPAKQAYDDNFVWLISLCRL
jgi:alkylhydroperoxidase/carboxymuconolactone decarboxylase family protein YurZ